MKSFLVFARQGDPPPQTDAMRGMTDPPPQQALLGYNCIGAIQAVDAQSAAAAAVQATRRVSKFAVVEAEFIDFTTMALNEPEGSRPLLNA